MAGRNPQERLRFRIFIGQLGEQCRVLISFHIVEYLAHICDTVGILHQSKLCFTGPLAELAAVAEGPVWELDGEPLFRSACVIVSQGRHGNRLMHGVFPHANTVSVTAAMEDGYIVVYGSRL